MSAAVGGAPDDADQRLAACRGVGLDDGEQVAVGRPLHVDAIVAVEGKDGIETCLQRPAVVGITRARVAYGNIKPVVVWRTLV